MRLLKAKSLARVSKSTSQLQGWSEWSRASKISSFSNPVWAQCSKRMHSLHYHFLSVFSEKSSRQGYENWFCVQTEPDKKQINKSLWTFSYFSLLSVFCFQLFLFLSVKKKKNYMFSFHFYTGTLSSSDCIYLSLILVPHHISLVVDEVRLSWMVSLEKDVKLDFFWQQPCSSGLCAWLSQRLNFSPHGNHWSETLVYK